MAMLINSSCDWAQGSVLRHHAFWHEAHDETHSAVHAIQAGLGFMLWQAKVENLQVVVH